MDEIQALTRALERPFPVKSLRFRPGATTKDKTRCIALAYIDARDVMKRLDDVVGIDRWQARYTHVTPRGVVCEIGIKIGEEWVWKANGAGESDIEGEKGAMSDAFKRAGVMLGIGRYLYSMPNVWVAYDAQRKRITEAPKVPAWATPEGYDELMSKRGDK